MQRNEAEARPNHFHYTPIKVGTEAASRVESLLEDYSGNLSKSSESHGTLEAECAAQRHRFTPSLRELIKLLRETLTALGDSVNRGDHDAFDVTKARFEKYFLYLSEATATLRLSKEAKAALNNCA